jgi:preprotein translocase subunit Sss1
MIYDKDEGRWYLSEEHKKRVKYELTDEYKKEEEIIRKKKETLDKLQKFGKLAAVCVISVGIICFVVYVLFNSSILSNLFELIITPIFIMSVAFLDDGNGKVRAEIIGPIALVIAYLMNRSNIAKYFVFAFGISQLLIGAKKMENYHFDGMIIFLFSLACGFIYLITSQISELYQLINLLQSKVDAQNKQLIEIRSNVIDRKTFIDDDDYYP